MKMTADEIIRDLAYCTCADYYQKHWLGIKFTSGVERMAEICEAFWLIDAVASYQTAKFRALNPFQSWRLKPAPTKKEPDRHLLWCEDGNGNIIKRQSIPFSDFPLDSITLWVENDVILLPSEH